MSTDSKSVWSQHSAEARDIARDFGAPDASEVDDLLARASRDALSLREANRLFNVIYSADFPVLKERVYEASREARLRTFGNKFTVMAPVEVSNRCASDCLFCGWRASNPDIPRSRISAELVLEQVEYLFDLGIGYIELVGGDDFRFVREELPALTRAARERMKGKDLEGRMCVCSMAVTEQHYHEWKAAGVDAMFVWQETYDPDLYAEKIVAGPKARGITDDWQLGAANNGYRFRVTSQERAQQAGLDVGIGFMIGLNPDINYEFIMTLQHAFHLIRNRNDPRTTPIIVGMPTWNKITTPRTDTRPTGLLDLEETFPFLAAVFFLSLPKGSAWVFPNCRVSLQTQIETIAIAGPFTSTEVKLGPGGYMPAAIRRRAARGENVDALRKLVQKECGIDSEDLARMERELDLGEQFVHHFHTHDVYMEALRKRGFEAVPFSELLSASGAKVPGA